MPKINAKALTNIGAWAGATAGGVVIPAYTFFRDYTPPFVPMPLILTPLAGAIVYAFGRSDKGRATDALLRKLLGRALVTILVAALLISVYALCLSYWTAPPPRAGFQRYQVGFGTASWSLTPHGRELHRKYPGYTSQELLLADGGFVVGGPERIWSTWSIVVAGSTLIVLYLLALVFWSAGFGLLRKHQHSRGT